MRVSVVIEDQNSRYESSFDIEDPAVASERLAFVVGDVEKRFIKKPSRAPAAAPTKPTTRPASSLPATNSGGAL